jgi:hypothetical protein
MVEPSWLKFSDFNSSPMHNRHAQDNIMAALSIPSLVSSPLQRPKRPLVSLLAFLSLGLTLSWASGVAAQTSSQTPTQIPTQTSSQIAQTSTPPAELTDTLTQIDTAATNGDLRGVMRFYSPAFTNTDGLTYDSLQTVLSDLWKRYPDLTYQTTLDSWEPQGNGFSTVTTTTITGNYPDDRRNLGLSATITSRQRIEDNKIVEQQILDERSQLTSGDKPPTITINLPEQVAAGEEFEFDAVVMEPLGDRLLLGSALEEPIGVDNYLNPTPIELELLASGGLFKVGEAPKTAGDRWISAVIVRYDGITAVTQRLRVGNQPEN